MSPLDEFYLRWNSMTPPMPCPIFEVINQDPDLEDMPDQWAGAMLQGEARVDVTMGTNPWTDERGEIVVGLLARSGAGRQSLDAAAEALKGAFQGYLTPDNSLHFVEVIGPEDITPQANGEWWRLGFRVPYVMTGRRPSPILDFAEDKYSLDFYMNDQTPDPVVSPFAIVEHDAVDAFNKINPADGHSMTAEGTDAFVNPDVAVDFAEQKNIRWPHLSGLLRNDFEYRRRGLLAATATYQYMNPMELFGTFYPGELGSVPAQSKADKGKSNHIHKKAISSNWIAQMAINEALRTKQLPPFATSMLLHARWMAGSADLVEFMGERTRTNQLASATGFICKTGWLFNDAALIARGVELWQQIFATRLTPAGVYVENPEKDGIGFDGNYQFVTLEECLNYLMLLKPSAWRDTVEANTRLGLNYWLQCIDPVTGIINDQLPQVWTRTEEKLPRQPGRFPRTFDTDGIPLRLMLAHYVLGPEGFATPLDVLGLRNIEQGQSFAHQTDDPPDEGEGEVP